MPTDMKPETADKTILERLNQEYVDAFMNADVEWYREHLAEDFVVIEPDGSILNKAQFLISTANGPDVTEYKLEEVDVRIFGNVALIRATGLWNGKDGSKGMSRYIDAYVKTGQEWKAVSAQITRARR